MKVSTITSRLVFSMSLFLALVLGISATGTYLYFKQQTTSGILSHQFTMLITIARGLDEKLYSSQRSLNAVAGAAHPELFKNPDTAQAWLDNRKGTRQIFDNGLFLFTSEGKLLVESPQLPDRRGKDFSFREYYKKTVATGKPYISNPYPSSKDNKPSIMLTAPVYAGGRLIGILGGSIDLLAQDSLFHELIDTRIGKTGYLYLYAPDRTMIAHPDRSRIMKQDVKPGMNHLFDRAIEGFEGSGETVNSRGLHTLASFKRLQSTGWILALNYPVAEAYEPIYQFRNYYLIGMFVLLLLAIALARKVGAGISRPLTDLTGQIQCLKQTHARDTRLKSTGTDEIQLLATSFNELLDEIERKELLLTESEAQLHQSQKLESVGRLAGGIAHDFNNKLMVILGNAEFACMDLKDKPDSLECIHEIMRAAEHSRDITAQMLAFSRQQVVTPRILNANYLITETEKSLSCLIGEQITLVFNLADDLWDIRIDPVQFDQILFNLATNARDAMPDGGTFTIETANITMDEHLCSTISDCIPGEYVRVTLRDTGTGMDQETIQRIFEPFFTTKEQGKGTGLGLATIHGIVRQSNGFIDVHSTPGEGTVFMVYLPVVHAAPGDHQQ